MKKLGLEKAKKIMKTYLSIKEREKREIWRENVKIIMMNEYEEGEDYFIFGYDFFEETPEGLKHMMVAGSGPIFIDKETGNLYPFTSGYEREEYIEYYKNFKLGIVDEDFRGVWVYDPFPIKGLVD